MPRTQEPAPIFSLFRLKHRTSAWVLLFATTLALTFFGSVTHAQTVIGGLSAGLNPRGIAVNPVTNRVYVANEGSGTVRMLDRVTFTSSTVAVGASPVAVAVNSGTNRIYAANFGGNSVSVIDGNTNTVTATVGVGTNPVALTVNPVTNKIYVANQGSANVTVIDGGTHATSTVASGSQPISVAINASTNKIYVANFASNSVTVIDGATNATNTVAVGTQPRALAISMLGNTVFVANSGSGNVTAIDGRTLTSANLAAGTTPRAIAINVGAGKVFVANGGSNDVTVITLGSLSTSTIAVGTNPSAVVVNPATGHTYVANQGSNNLTVINSQSGTTSTLAVGTGPQAIGINPVTNRIHVVNTGSNDLTLIDGDSFTSSNVATGLQPNPIAINPVSNKVFIGNYGTNTVTVMDGTSLAKVDVTVPANPRVIAVNTATNKAYVGSVASATVTVINGDTYATQSVAVDQVPVAIAVNPATNRIYVLTQAAKVTVIDGSTLAKSTVLTSNFPADIAVNPATNKVYVANADTLNVIDGTTNVVTNIAATALNGKVAVNPLTNRIYLTNTSTNILTVVDGATNGVVTTLGMGSLPYALAINAETNKIYVANHNSNNVSVVDGATHSIATVAVGTNPNAIAVNPVTEEVYVTNRNSSFVTQFDGHYRFAVNIPTGGNTWDVAVNPVTGRVFVTNWSSDNVTVLSPTGAAGGPQATVSIAGGNATSRAAPTANISVCCTPYETSPAIRGVYLRMHDENGVFTGTAGTGPFSINLSSVRSGLNFGVVYPIDTSEGSATNPGGNVSGGAGTVIGAPSVFAFTKVNTPAIITPSPLPNGAVNAAYSLQVATTGGAGALTFDSTGMWPPGVSMSTSGLISGTPTTTGFYTVSVIATDSSGSSGSQIFPFTIVTGLPTAPTMGTATGADRSATITFTPSSSNGGTPITIYEAISSPGNITASCTAPCSSITVNGLTNAFIYTFRVRAVNAVGAGPYSGNSNSVTPAGLPGAPPLTGVQAGNGEVKVSFTNAASNGALISSYTATASPGGATGTCIVMGSCTSIVVSGLTNGVAYTFTVTATNAAGTGPASAPSMPVTPADVPGPPVIGSATAGNNQATVTFSPPAYAGGAPITAYTAVARFTALSATCAAPCSSITIPGLTNGVTYDFVVTATNAIGTSLPSAVSNTVYPAGPPNAPTNVAASAGNAVATVTFTPSSQNNGFPISIYVATASPGGVANFCTAPCTLINVTGLTNGTAYTFTVTASNARGTGAASAPSNSVVPLGPPAPPVITSVPPPNATLNVAYSHTVKANASPLATCSVTTGALPTGLFLNNMSGVISGTPTVAGTFTGVITASNGLNPAATQAFSIDARNAQTISFGAAPTIRQGETGMVNATGGASGNPIVFTSTTPGICGVSGSMVTGIAQGMCTIAANQAGNASYYPAPEVTQTFTVDAPAITFTGEVYSRKLHGNSVGVVDLPLADQPITGSYTVEPRNAQGGHTIVFRFTAPVTAVGPVTLTDVEPPATIDTTTAYSGNDLIVTLSNVPDATRLVVNVSGVNNALSVSRAVGFLVGDLNSSKAVTAADIGAVKSRSGAMVTLANALADIDLNGVFNNIDISAAKARAGRTIP